MFRHGDITPKTTDYGARKHNERRSNIELIEYWESLNKLVTARYRAWYQLLVISEVGKERIQRLSGFWFV